MKTRALIQAPGIAFALVAALVACHGCKLLSSIAEFDDGESGEEDAGIEADAKADVTSPDASGCAEGLEEACYGGPPGTLNTGVCRAGTRKCAQGAWGACSGDIGPSPELCDKDDNDCDGLVDEELSTPCYSGPAGTAEKGLCSSGMKKCVAGTWQACEGEVTPKAEDCNGQDDDCNGLEDDFAGPQTCYAGPPQTEGIGECAAGTRVCQGGSWTSCTGEVTPVAETCDGKDNDCNEIVDDEPPDIHEGVPCGQQCLNAVNDADCDGLVGNGSQDMWPSTCNPLLFTDRFAVQPALPKWLVSGTTSWSCGKATLEAGAQLALATPPAAITAPDYLAEARFSLGPETTGLDWSVGISSAVQGSNHHRTCEVFATSLTAPNAHFRLSVSNGTQSGGHTYSAYNVDWSPGATYIVQSYGTGDMHYCRLLSGSGVSKLVAAQDTSGTVALASAGTIAVFARGRSAVFDYARIFQVP